MFGNDDHNDAKPDAVSASGQPATAPPSEVVHPDPLAVTAVAADDMGSNGSGISDTDTPASEPTTAPPAPSVPTGPEPGPSLSEVFSAGETTGTHAAPAPSPTHAPTLPSALPPTPPVPPAPAAQPSADNDLIDLKREALTQLSPLVDELDQPADEKFRTLMMMIQASDDQSMVRHAYDTALKIEDEKERAQALLDIVNEINYFTQTASSPDTDLAI